MRKLALALILIGFVNSLSAQDYKTAVGVRIGIAMGVNVKHNLDSYNAVEGIFTHRWGGFILSGLYEYIQPTSEAGLNWYYGIGAHIGYWDSKRSGEFPGWWEKGHDGAYTIVGVDGIIGIEYTLENAPFNLSVDWKPVFNILGISALWGDMVAITIRYTLPNSGERKYRRKKDRYRRYYHY